MEMVGSPPTCCGISCAGHSSCITISNLGQVSFPDAVRRELVRLDFLLTPRAHSPYNCGIASVGDTLSLTITRRGKDPGRQWHPGALHEKGEVWEENATVGAA